MSSRSVLFIGSSSLQGGYGDQVLAIAKKFEEDGRLIVVGPVNIDLGSNNPHEFRLIHPIKVMFCEFISVNVQVCALKLHKLNVDVIITSDPLYLPVCVVIKMMSKSNPGILLDFLSPPVGKGPVRILSDLTNRLFLLAGRRFLSVVATHTPDFTKWLPRKVLRNVLVEPVMPGVNCERFSPDRIIDNDMLDLRETIGIPSNHSIIMYHGSISEGRGIEVMLEAMTEVSRTEPRASLVIVGDGPFFLRAKELSSKLGINNAIYMTGRVPVDDLYRYLGMADVCIIPLPESEKWGVPYKMMESMAMGKAIVATDIYVNRLVDPEGKFCFFVEPNNPSALAERILGLFRKPMKDRGINYGEVEYARSNFSWEKRADILLGLLNI
jgi:glycosyltransferase involved in cell wall biosynthesis